MKNSKMALAAAAVVIASRGAKDVMRKLVAMEKIFSKNQEVVSGQWSVVSG